MPKSKKTRQQKIRSDIRQKQMPMPQVIVSSQEGNTVSHTVKPVLSSSMKNSNRAPISTSTYTYLSHDLRKTLVLTCSIVILEIVLHYIVN